MQAPDRWRTVGMMLAAGAAYDAAFGVVILAFPRPAATLLGLTVPSDPVYFDLNGILLLLLAGLYAAAAREPARYRAVALIAGLGRVAGCCFFASMWAGGHPAAFLALGVADLAVGLATLVAWRRASVLSA